MDWPNSEQNTRIEAAFTAARQQVERLKEEAHQLYLKAVAVEGSDQCVRLTAEMQAKDVLVDEMCRVLSNLSAVAEARLIRRNMQAFIEENAL